MCKLCEAECALTDELERVILENKSDGHNKQYTIFIEPTAGCFFRVMARWGPIGKWERAQPKSVPLTLSAARIMREELEEKKLKRGYRRRVCG